MSEKPVGQKHSQRDAEILMALGGFLLVLSLPVLVGTFFAEDAVPRLINLAAGAIIFTIGALMVWRGRWTRRHLD